MNELPQPIQDWMAGGRFARVDNVRLFYRMGGDQRSDLPWLVCFHGFPTSSWDWHLLLPYLEETHRVLVFDFPGYGLSEKSTGRDYSLLRQLDAAEALLEKLGIRSFDLLAHDMGNSVACELLRRREQGAYPFDLNSLTLLNGGIYMDLHRALLTQKLLRTPIVGAVTGRLTSWRVFRMQYPRVYANPEQFDNLHYQCQWALLLHHHGRRTLHRIAGYMKERRRMGDAWTGPLHRLELPLTVIWGEQDSIAVHEIAQRLARNNKNTHLVTLEGIGHYPQLESPSRVWDAMCSEMAGKEKFDG